MHATASEQIQAIHAMMASGHRSVRMEGHTLILWGVTGAALILITNAVFTPERFPLVWQRSIAANIFIAIVLAAVGAADYALTRRARRRRDETISFVQLQVMKVWWLLMGLVVLLNLGMNFFGGGYMFYGATLAILGLAFYVHGLFSEQMLSWIGVLLISVGFGSVALKLPFPTMEWLAVFVFGVGLPALGLALRTGRLHATLLRRAALSCAWLVVVIGLTAVSAALAKHPIALDARVIPLHEFIDSRTSAEPQVVRLPAGTVVPLQVEITGDVLEGANTAVVPLKLARDLDVALRDGKPDGYFRVHGSEWKKYLYNYRVREFDMHATLTPGRGPEVSLRMRMSTDN